MAATKYPSAIRARQESLAACGRSFTVHVPQTVQGCWRLEAGPLDAGRDFEDQRDFGRLLGPMCARRREEKLSARPPRLRDQSAAGVLDNNARVRRLGAELKSSQTRSFRTRQWSLGPHRSPYLGPYLL